MRLTEAIISGDQALISEAIKQATISELRQQYRELSLDSGKNHVVLLALETAIGKRQKLIGE